MRRALGCLSLVVLGVLVLCTCLLVAFAPRKAGATAAGCTFDSGTQVLTCTDPTPVPFPYPTACVTAVPSSDQVCGIASITVGHDNGEWGPLLLLAVVVLFGFGLLAVSHIVYGFIRR